MTLALMIMLTEMNMTMIDDVDQNCNIGINYTDDDGDCNDHGIDYAADDDDNGDDVDVDRLQHNDDDNDDR